MKNLKKLCRDCKWCSVSDTGDEFAKCRAPQNIEMRKKLNPLTGVYSTVKGWHLEYCEILRNQSWFNSVMINYCGRSGRWFEPDKESFWRTLVRIEKVVTSGNDALVSIVMSGWKPKEVIDLRLGEFPSDMHPLIKKGKRLHARVNIGVEKSSELRFKDWETE